MSSSVLVQDANGQPIYQTQQVGLFKDSVSVAQSTSGMDFCTSRIYSISFAPVSSTTALTTTELSINPTTGLISFYTARDSTMGTHTVTVTVKLSGY
jgi:hypothetical protein